MGRKYNKYPRHIIYPTPAPRVRLLFGLLAVLSETTDDILPLYFNLRACARARDFTFIVPSYCASSRLRARQAARARVCERRLVFGIKASNFMLSTRVIVLKVCLSLLPFPARSR